MGYEPRTSPPEHTFLPTRVQSNALMRSVYKDRCINRVSVNVLSKGQGGAILPLDGTKLQELKEMENGINRE